MEVRQLQIFRILAEELNFTRTAEKVHTVQSNVTAQIKALEEELGGPLFDRLGRRVTLTDAGRSFLPLAPCVSEFPRVCSLIACPRCCASSIAAFPTSS